MTAANIIDMCGAAGAAISFIMFLPQAIKAWTHRHNPAALAGISTSGQTLVLANAAIWAIYGIGTGAIWVAVPSFINAPLAVGTIAVLTKGKRHTEGSTP